MFDPTVTPFTYSYRVKFKGETSTCVNVSVMSQLQTNSTDLSKMFKQCKKKPTKQLFSINKITFIRCYAGRSVADLDHTVSQF